MHIELLLNGPIATRFERMDEVKAARELVLPQVLAAGRLSDCSRVEPADRQSPGL